MLYQFYRLGPDLEANWPLSGGMVLRISEDARKCVVFFGIDAGGASDNAGVPLNISYGGTGFLVVFPDKGVNVPYLITCRHVAKLLSKHPEFYIRANTIGGESYTLPVRKIEWAYHEDATVDLAAASFALQPHIFDVKYYPLGAASAVLGAYGRLVDPTGALVDFWEPSNTSGWYAGGGFDYMLNKTRLFDLIGGVEYEHVSLDTVQQFSKNQGFAPGDFQNAARATVDAVWAKLTLKFNPLAY